MTVASINEITSWSWIPNLWGEFEPSQLFKFLQKNGKLNNLSDFETKINTRSTYYRRIKSYNGTDKIKHHYIGIYDEKPETYLYVILFDNEQLIPSTIILFLEIKTKYDFLAEFDVQTIESRGLVNLKTRNYTKIFDDNFTCQEIKEYIPYLLDIASTITYTLYKKDHFEDYGSKRRSEHRVGISFNRNQIEALKEFVKGYEAQIEIHSKFMKSLDHSSTDGHIDHVSRTFKDFFRLRKSSNRSRTFKDFLRLRKTIKGSFVYGENLLKFYNHELPPQFCIEKSELFNQLNISVDANAKYIYDLNMFTLSESSDEMSKSINFFNQILVFETILLLILTAILAYAQILKFLSGNLGT